MAKRKGRVSRQGAFLAAFAECGNLTRAAKSAKIERDMHYRWLKDDPDYPALFDEARVKAADLLEEEARRRAVEGVFEPTTHKGEFVYPFKYVDVPDIDEKTGAQKTDPETGAVLWRTKRVYSKVPYGVRKYSDRLLEFLIKGHKPERFREKSSVELTGAGGGAIEIVQQLLEGRKRVAEARAAAEKAKAENTE